MVWLFLVTAETTRVVLNFEADPLIKKSAAKTLEIGAFD